jgi:hypothetical protein
MAKRVFSTSISYATPTALGSLATSGQYMALKANTTAATQLIDVLEAVIQGINTASAIFGGVLARCSTNETGAQTALASPNSDGPQNPGSAALTNPPNTFVASATNQPTPSSVSTDTKIPLSINAFGGLYRENFAPTQQFSVFGAATPFQEAALFNCTGFGGAACSVNAMLIYEPY